jgi:hypothetical protein
MAEGGITSSADRMVGADHAEVRYFTRYVQTASIFCVLLLTTFITATIIMVFGIESLIIDYY